MMLFFARMALGLWGLRRILHHAKSLPELGGCCFETAAFVVPASVGCFRPRILLPLGWRDWDAKKLKAVIAHETAHTRRRDWLISVVSRVNVCVFWFHPLAWWMDRELASLAEEACDDIALSEIEDRDQYAATLVEFARAAADHGGLLNWGAVSMAKESNVGRRLNRIVNWRLAAAKPFGRMAWVALLTCSMPLVYLSAAVQLAPVNRPAAGLERPDAPSQSLQTPVSPPRTLIAQSARKQAPGSAQAVSICILIDNSGSMRGNQDQAKAAALALIKAFRPGDEFCIVNFNDESYLSADLTTDSGRARDALTKVESRGGSALRDATLISVDYLVNKAHNRKVLVLITDGSDTSSVASEEQVQDRIRNRGVVVYSIALMNGQDIEKASEGEQTLKQLAGVNGGLYYHSDAPADVERIASEIMRDARDK
jgi:Mg-chelatase subunit ChlD